MPVSDKMIRDTLASMGVTDYELGWAERKYELDAIAPVGHVWRATDCHSLVISCFSGPAAARVAMLEDIRQGMRPCDNSPCDYCEGN